MDAKPRGAPFFSGGARLLDPKLDLGSEVQGDAGISVFATVAGVFYFAAMISLERITFDPEQCGGRPCIRGMRIRVKDVLELLAAGGSQTEILEDFPYLEAEDIHACLAFAAQGADHVVIPTPA